MAFSVVSTLRTLQPQVGVELGSRMTRMVIPGKGVVIEEPTALVSNQKEKKTVLVGQDALEMEGKIASPLQLQFPVQDGELHDDELAVKVLRHFLQKALGKSYLLKPEVMASIPTTSSQVQRQTLKEVLFNAGARQVYLIDEVLAAAIGAGVPVADSGGNIVLHLGGGHSEVAVISLGTIVKSAMHPLGGMYVDHRLRRFLRQYYQFEMSISQAEKLKSQLSFVKKRPKHLNVKGRVLSTSLPGDVNVEHDQLLQVVIKALEPIQLMMSHFLEDIPPALAADVIDKGVILSGGLAQLEGVDSYFAQLLGIPVTVAEQPHRVVIQGIELALEHLPLYKQSLAFE